MPIEKIVSRFWKSLQNLKEILPETDRCYIYDNSIDNAAAELIFKTVNGTIKKIYSERNPVWTTQLLDSINKEKNIKNKIYFGNKASSQPL